MLIKVKLFRRSSVVLAEVLAQLSFLIRLSFEKVKFSQFWQSFYKLIMFIPLCTFLTPTFYVSTNCFHS